MTTIFIIATIILALWIGIYLFMKTPKFGSTPKGQRLKRIVNSPNSKGRQFQNVNFTPPLANGATYFTVIRKFFFTKKIRNKPSRKLPAVKTDLKALSPEENILVWFGHSSYFIQIDGKTFLVDPVLSGAASPISFTTKSYPGTDVYSADDFPEIDYLVLTHDHWDHLDYKTVKKLKPKTNQIITGLGTGAHLRRWGFSAETVFENDWNETLEIGSGFTIHTTTARHFSGRGFKRNQAIWLAMVLETPTRKIYIGGDSGYDVHFAEIGEKFGTIDLAILECGQYNEDWKYIHMLPHEVVLAAKDLNAENLLPVHWGKFSLSVHPWDEPISLVTAEAEKASQPIWTPMIGEKIDLDNPQEFQKWWKTVDG